MSTLLSRSRTALSHSRPTLFSTLQAPPTCPAQLCRAVSTLPNNPHIYIHPSSSPSQQSWTLSLLPTTPPNPSLAIGTSTSNPPTPDSLTENPTFLDLLHDTIKEHACEDPDVKAQAALYASQAGSALGSGGMFFPQSRPQRQRGQKKKAAGAGLSNAQKNQSYGGAGGAGGDGAGGASSQGGIGGAGRGGYIHVSDQRSPPDYGRVAWPEDIFGSLEVDGEGGFVDNGRYQRSGTYRVVTREGVLGLSQFLRGKVVGRLEGLEEQTGKNRG